MTEKLSSNENEHLVQIKDNYDRICENIAASLSKSGRKDKVRLMAVTKTVPFQYVNYAVSLGIDLLGENRVQEFLGKYDYYDKGCQIDFIGGLQCNKVKYLIGKVKTIHSVDSEKLAEEISKRSQLNKCNTDILIEVNIGREQSKGGADPDNLSELADKCMSLPGVTLRGFMAIPPIDDKGSNVKYFQQMELIYNNYRSKLGDQIDTLSMGMSNDYENAVMYGSNIVRIGSALFGKRG